MPLARIFLVLGLLVASLVDPAHAATLCALEGDELTVSLDPRSDPPYVLGRSAGGEIQLDGVSCGGATVTNTEIIGVEPSGEPGDTYLVLDTSNGGFAPGASTGGETLPEIGIHVDLGDSPDTDDQLILSGGESADAFTIGRGAIQLNADDDMDLTVTDLLDVTLKVLGNGGGDSISAAGGGETGPPLEESITIEGGSGADSITGGVSSDNLIGGEGADHIDGGPEDPEFSHFDIAVYSASASAVTVNLAAGTGAGGDAQGDVFVGIAAVEGTEFNDTLTGNDDNNGLFGSDGNDTMIGGAGDDQFEGGPGTDTMTGGDGNDEIQHYGSQSPIQADLGAQTVTGGDATGDTISEMEGVVGSDFDDTLVGSEVDDSLSGYFGNDTLKGLGGNDFLHPGHDNDSAEGGDGDDYFYSKDSGDGTDVLDGGLGEDYADYDGRDEALTLSLDGIANDGEAGENDNLLAIEQVGSCHLGDLITGSLSRETILSNGGPDDVNALGGPDFVVGGEGGDDVSGGGGEDRLLGSSGGDELVGGKGNDTLNGGPGADVLNGGPGEDVCVVDSKDVVKNCEVKRNNQR